MAALSSVLWALDRGLLPQFKNRSPKKHDRGGASTAKAADARMMARTFVMISLVTAARAFTGALGRATALRKGTARFASHPVSMRMRTWPLLKG